MPSNNGKKKNSSKKNDILYSDPDPILFSDYVDGIRIAGAYMKPMARMLWNARPADQTAAARKQLEVVVEIADRADDVLDDREGVALVKPWFEEFGDVWGGAHDTLHGKSRIPSSISDVGLRAAKLIARLYPDGIMFIRKDAHAAWADGDRRLKLIDELQLKSELDEVVGPELFVAMKQATEALGEAIGVGRTAREVPKPTEMQETIVRFSREVAKYSRIMAAEVDITDRVSVERFRKSVAAPIDAFRSRRASDGGTSGEPVTPVSPTEPTDPSTPVDPTPVG